MNDWPLKLPELAVVVLLPVDGAVLLAVDELLPVVAPPLVVELLPLEDEQAVRPIAAAIPTIASDLRPAVDAYFT